MPKEVSISSPTGTFRLASGEYAVTGITGTIGAALAALASVFVMRFSPTGRFARIKEVRIKWQVVTAFTAPNTPGRRLALYRGSGAAASGGTAIASAAQHDSNYVASFFNAANGGDMRIATTGALGVAGITFETDPLHVFPVGNFGAAGSADLQVVDLSDAYITLNPGELLAIRSPAAMDAAGTWVLQPKFVWTEA